jgi:hypothetical protein
MRRIALKLGVLQVAALVGGGDVFLDGTRRRFVIHFYSHSTVAAAKKSPIKTEMRRGGG